MRSYYVYILQCSDGSYYTGVTNDYETRVYQHQSGADPSCYTYKRRPVELVYLAEFCDVQEAIGWEKHIKKWSRRKKEALIRGKYEQLPELAKGCFARYIDSQRAMVRRAHHDTLCYAKRKKLVDKPVSS